MYRFACLIGVLLTAQFAHAAANWKGDFEPCRRSSELAKHGHMDVGVWINISDPVLRTQFQRALDFWAEILDMTWHEQDSPDCTMQVVYGSSSLFDDAAIVARSQFVNRRNFHGWIAFNATWQAKETDIYVAAVHEIGHMMGLQHNSDPESIMVFLNPKDPPLLDEADVVELAKHHKLRLSAATVAADAHQLSSDLVRGFKSDHFGSQAGAFAKQ